MLNRISRASTKVLLDKNIILESKEKVYIYGFEVIYSTMFCYACMLVMGIICKRIWETLIFLVYFTVIRQAVGGYHASTYRRCFFLTNFVYILESALSIIICKDIRATLGVFVLSIIYMYFKAPSPNTHRKVTEERRKKLRERAILYLIICSFSVVTFWVLDLKVVVPVIASTMAVISGMIYINEKGGLKLWQHY